MPRTRTYEIGWTDSDGDDYRVTLSASPGSPGSRWEPPEGPEIEIVSVREDKPGGAMRPDLIDTVSAELDGPLGDRAAEEIADNERDAYNDAMERRADERRDGRIDMVAFARSALGIR